MLGVHVYDDSSASGWHDILVQLEAVSPYALTGAVFARDRAAVVQAEQVLRYAACTSSVKHKPAGAVVGKQPFGGVRASGTNDTAASTATPIPWMPLRALNAT